MLPCKTTKISLLVLLSPSPLIIANWGYFHTLNQIYLTNCSQINSQKLVNPKNFLYFNLIIYALLVSVLIFKLRWTLAEDYYFTVWSAVNNEKERFCQMKHRVFFCYCCFSLCKREWSEMHYVMKILNEVNF